MQQQHQQHHQQPHHPHEASDLQQQQQRQHNQQQHQHHDFIPIGASASFSLLLNRNNIIYFYIKKLNAAYTTAWHLINIFLFLSFVFVFPLFIFLFCLSLFKKGLFDEYVLYTLITTCSQINAAAFPYGFAFMLLEAKIPGAATAAADAAGDAAAAAHADVTAAEVLWVLRVFIMPDNRETRSLQTYPKSPQWGPPEAPPSGGPFGGLHGGPHGGPHGGLLAV